MTGRAVFGRRVSEGDDANGRCVECGRPVLLDEPLRPGEIALCALPCGCVTALRGTLMLWVNPEHQALSRRLRMSPSRAALSAHADPLADLNRPITLN